MRLRFEFEFEFEFQFELSICLLSLPPLCISYPGCPLPDDAHTLATSGSLLPPPRSFPLSTCAKVSEASFHSLFLKAQSIFGKQPSMHMTNSDRARNDMLYSLYRSITSVSTHTSHSHSHTHTHSHSLPALVCASECAFDDLQKVLASPSFFLLCLVAYPVKGQPGRGHILTYCWHIALAFPCLLFIFIVVARVFHLHDKNQWQRLRRNAKLRFRLPLFFSLSLTPATLGTHANCASRGSRTFCPKHHQRLRLT